MLLFKSRQISLVLLSLWLLIVSTACSNIGTTPSVPTSTTQPKIDTPPSSTPIPATSTTCPAAGKGRVAIMPPLKLGTHQTIVYLADLSQGNNGPTPPMALERYDVSTGKASIITDGLIRTALLSHDGQWLMLGVLEETAYQIQLIRLDGQDRQ